MEIKNNFYTDGFKVTETSASSAYDLYEKTNPNNKRERAPKLPI